MLKSDNCATKIFKSLSVIGFQGGYIILNINPAWAKGFDQDTSIFSTIGVTGLIPQFRNPEKLLEGEIAVLRPKRGSGFSRYWVIGQSQGVLV